MRVAGLAPVEIEGIENINVTEFVPGHMSYRAAMPRMLREAGWMVESDEFTEIEDPDPENHKARQRELINEIEEARKLLEEKPAKSRFGFFRSKKKLAEKKDWETYDEKLKAGLDDQDALEGKASGVLFDIDALQAEVAALAAEGITVKELPQSTLPPMKLDLKGPPLSPARQAGLEERSQSAPPSKSNFSSPLPSATFTNPTNSPDLSKVKTVGAAAAGIGAAGGVAAGITTASKLERPSTEPKQAGSANPFGSSSAAQRPGLTSFATAPIDLNHNAWADEFGEDFGKEKEVQLSFE
jgi:hypothetical protein